MIIPMHQFAQLNLPGWKYALAMANTRTAVGSAATAVLSTHEIVGPIKAVLALDVQLSAALGVGESVSVVVDVLRADGTTATVATVPLTNATPTPTLKISQLTLVNKAVALNNGDYLRVRYTTYVAGGAATNPSIYTTVQLGWPEQS